MADTTLQAELRSSLDGLDTDVLRRELDRLSAGRALLIEQGIPSEYEAAAQKALSAALFIELLLQQSAPTAANDTLNEIAHSLTQAMDLLGEPLESQLENVELAAGLFSAAEQTPKAVSVLSGYRRLIDAMERTRRTGSDGDTSFPPLLRAFVTAFVRRDMKAVSRIAGHMKTAARSEQFERDEARIALTLAAFGDQVDYIARERAKPEDTSALQAKLRVAERIAVRGGDTEAVSATHRLRLSLRAFTRNATRLAAARADVELPAPYWAA
jgi:hypothetical protein